MAKKEKYFMGLYLKYAKEGQLEDRGLCNCNLLYDTPDKQTLHLFVPTILEKDAISQEGNSTVYWGSGMPDSDPTIDFAFTALRQNILLFCAALNNEL